MLALATVIRCTVYSYDLEIVFKIICLHSRLIGLIQYLVGILYDECIKVHSGGGMLLISRCVSDLSRVLEYMFPLRSVYLHPL